MQTITNAISINELFFKYEKEFVLENINLEVKEKDFLTILGPNGGGKSTLLKLILGISPLKKGDISIQQKEYFNRIEAMGLKSPRLIGFGIHDNKTFETACQYSQGAIVGSAYIRALADTEDIPKTTATFIQSLINN